MVEARRYGLVLFSIILILFGAALTPTPLPVGAIIMAVGFGILLANSRRAKIWAVHLMRRYPSLRFWRIKLRKLITDTFGKKSS